MEGKILKVDSESTTSPRALTTRDRIYRQFLFPTTSTKHTPPSFLAPILLSSEKTTTSSSSASKRHLKQTPIKVLDAPGLEDDFYLNLVDWEAKGNRVVVLLNGAEVYFWNANNGLGSNSSLGKIDLEKGGRY